MLFGSQEKIIIPGSSECSLWSMISSIERAVSPINLSFIKPDYLWWIISRRQAEHFILLAVTLEAIFASTLVKEIGLQFSK